MPFLMEVIINNCFGLHNYPKGRRIKINRSSENNVKEGGRFSKSSIYIARHGCLPKYSKK
jgi:hypothetical protein